MTTIVRRNESGIVAGAFAAIRHAGAEASARRSAHLAQIILDGLRSNPQ
jgi:hypothetical protein